MTFTADEFSGTVLGSQWLWKNQGTATATVANGQLVLFDTQKSAYTPRILYQPYTAPIKLSMRMTWLSAKYQPGTGTAGPDWGFVVFNDGGAEARTIAIRIRSWLSAPLAEIIYERLNSLAEAGGAVTAWGYREATLFLQMEDDGTTIHYRLGRLTTRAKVGDRGTIQWDEIGTDAHVLSMGQPSNAFGLLLNANGGDATMLVDWVRVGDGDPPTIALTRIASVAEPINLAPGYLIASSKTYASVNGTPGFSVSDGVVLDDEGYYEVDIFNDDGVATRHPICIVDASRLAAAIASPAALQPDAFHRSSTILAAAYPHGRVVPFVRDRSLAADVATDRAVYLEIRSRPIGGSYATLTHALAKRGGTWPSGAFNLAYGRNDLRLALTVSPADTVLA